MGVSIASGCFPNASVSVEIREEANLIASLKQYNDNLPQFISYTNFTVGEINRSVQPPGKNLIEFFRSSKMPEHVLRMGDPVVWLDDTYARNNVSITRGMTGRVIKRNGEHSCTIHWDSGDDTIITRNKHHRDPNAIIDPFGQKIALAYCLTAHKSQGSEFKSTLIAITSRDMFCLGRNADRRWLYTAVTRAQETITILEENKSVLQYLQGYTSKPLHKIKTMNVVLNELICLFFAIHLKGLCFLP